MQYRVFVETRKSWKICHELEVPSLISTGMDWPHERFAKICAKRVTTSISKMCSNWDNSIWICYCTTSQELSKMQSFTRCNVFYVTDVLRHYFHLFFSRRGEQNLKENMKRHGHWKVYPYEEISKNSVLWVCFHMCSCIFFQLTISWCHVDVNHDIGTQLKSNDQNFHMGNTFSTILNSRRSRTDWVGPISWSTVKFISQNIV